MKPGRELDALVAEKVTGWAPACFGEFEGNPLGGTNEAAGWCNKCGKEVYSKLEIPHKRDLPYYSTDISAALEVKAKLFEAHGDWILVGCSRNDGTFQAYLDFPESPDWKVIGESEAHAICLAALRACGVEIP